MQIAAPETVASAISERSTPVAERTLAPSPLPESLVTRIDAISGSNADFAATLRMLARDLIDHQNIRSADQYLCTLARVAERETDVAPGSTRFTRAVAIGLHKLTAYKDEYEVARLLVCDEGLASAREIAGEGDAICWLLHPPLLRALGLKRKIRVGLWAAPAMSMLAAAKRLRGTPFDPFGWTQLRRIERALPEQYSRAIERLLRELKPGRIDDAIEIARLPSDVRGYEDIKLANIKRYQQQLNELLADFEREGSTEAGLR
jgi:indolepyruvate ferredoxin oxidoreductase